MSLVLSLFPRLRATDALTERRQAGCPTHPYRETRMTCPAACPCRHPHFDPDRRLISVYSTGAFATVDEVEPGVFAYRYVTAAFDREAPLDS